MAKALPKTLYVKIEKMDDGTGYYTADTETFSLVEMGERVKIGTYQLVEVNTVEGVAKFTKA